MQMLERCVKRHAKKLDGTQKQTFSLPFVDIVKRKRDFEKIEDKWREMNNVHVSYDNLDQHTSTMSTMDTSDDETDVNTHVSAGSIRSSKTLNAAVLTSPLANTMYNDEVADMPRHLLKLVRQLSNILTEQMPDFWKLAKTIIAGKFSKQTQQAVCGCNF